MKPGDASSPPLRRAAAEQLGLAVDLDPGATRAPLLRHLLAAEFLPEAVDHEAILVLLGRPAGPTPLLLDRGTAAAAALRDEVESFAAGFFEVPVGPRRATWERLFAAAAGDDRLRARLRPLEAGLAVEPGSIPVADPLVRRLATEATELFLLDPAARAVATRGRVWALVGDPSIAARDRARARRTLLRRYRAVSALAPGYLDQLALVGRAARPWWRRWADEQLRTCFAANRRAIRIAQLGCAICCATLLFSYAIFVKYQPGTSRRPRPAFVPPPAVGPPAPDRRYPDRNADLIRVLLRRRVRDEVGRQGVRLDDEQARRIAMAVPLDADSGIAADLSRAFVDGRWTPRTAGIVAAGLRWGFAANRIGLTRDQVDTAIRAVVREYAGPLPIAPAATSKQEPRP